MSLPSDAAALDGLLMALDGAGALSARLAAFARTLGAALGGEVAVALPVVGEPTLVAGPASLLHDAAAARVAIDGGAALHVRPASALEERAGLVRAAARLLSRELAMARREARAARAEDVTSAVTHEMNNALTPLLCHSCEPVVRESLRLRGLLETLRVMRGRARPRELRFAGDIVERARKLLGVSGSGSFIVQTECASAVARRAVGPEQERLVPALLSAGYALRSRARPGTPLVVRADEEAGRVRFQVEAAVDAPADLSPDLEPLDAASGLEARFSLPAPGLARLSLVLLRRPRIVVLALDDDGRAAAVALALAGVGIDAVVERDAEAAIARALDAPEPAAVLVLPGAPAQPLRQGLHRAQPLLASRCVLLDDRFQPRTRPGPEEVDLGAVLLEASGGPPAPTRSA